MPKFKFFLLIVIALYTLCSCEEDEEISLITQKPTIVKIDNKIPFRLLVKGENRLDIRLDEGFIQTAKVYTTTEDDTTELVAFTPQLPNRFYLSANVEYTFPQNGVDLLLEIKKELNDTIYQIPILNYQHQYVNDLSIEQLIEFGNYLYQYELSPDGSTFFYTIHPSDGISNAKLYRYNLQTKENTLLEEDFKGADIRAISANEYYYITKFNGDRYLSLDTALLIRKNLVTNEEKVITEVSSDYGRFSRVIDDRILVVRPYLSEPNCLLINTTNDASKGVTFNYPMMLELRRDHIWLGNFRVLHNTNIQSFDVATENDFSIIAYDENTNQLQGVLYDYALGEFPYFRKIRVYENERILFQEKAWQRKNVSLITGNDHGQKPIVVYQKFFDSTKGAKDGFYFYSQTEPEGKLLFSEPDDHTINFWVDDDTFISVKQDGLYKYTLPAGL